MRAVKPDKVIDVVLTRDNYVFYIEQWGDVLIATNCFVGNYDSPCRPDQIFRVWQEYDEREGLVYSYECDDRISSRLFFASPLKVYRPWLRNAYNLDAEILQEALL